VSGAPTDRISYAKKRVSIEQNRVFALQIAVTDQSALKIIKLSRHNLLGLYSFD